MTVTPKFYLTRGDLTAALADYMRKLHPELFKTYDGGVEVEIDPKTSDPIVTLKRAPVRAARD